MRRMTLLSVLRDKMVAKLVTTRMAGRRRGVRLNFIMMTRIY